MSKEKRLLKKLVQLLRGVTVLDRLEEAYEQAKLCRDHNSMARIAMEIDLIERRDK